MLFAGTATGVVAVHRHPAWKLVLPLGAQPLELAGPAGRAELPGVLIPPEWPHVCRVPGGFARLSIDAHLLGPRSEPVVLSGRDRRRLLDALAVGAEVAGEPDLDAARAEVVALCGGADGVDERVLLAVERLGEASSLAGLARSVGLSAPRLRGLTQAQVGVPLARLRRWERLRRAAAVLPTGTVAEAAAGAGFADQAHLARTARELAGRSPSSMLS
ncbi:helix-turn-helix domain-containing protein [Nocardia sp. SSK8]|uniref:helix-turn-helix domain-containing protein n=1 Tax=Nocardia sp. SSK8 TaxID=3120154 RepID=UPI00300A256E